MIYYGPHACEICGQTIVKQAREEGGASFDPPPLLMRIFYRGSEAGNPDVAYPMVWTPHVCPRIYPVADGGLPNTPNKADGVADQPRSPEPPIGPTI